MENSVEADTDVKKQSFFARAIKKLAKWTLIIIVAIIFAKFIGGLKEEQKQEFFTKSKQQAVLICNENTNCAAMVEKHFDSCIDDNYSSHKSGKFNRKYTFDPEGFMACVNSRSQ